MPGPDHKASLEPDELKAMVTGIRQIEKAIGNGIKVPANSELGNLSIVRKSLVASKPIQKGEIFTKENIAVKRPGNGKNPMLYWEMLKQSADKNYMEDEVI